jgi:RHS repeat-associated protein
MVRFYPWGGELHFTDSNDNHYKFSGKECDSETGLDYFGARYYSNGLGRFITPGLGAKPAAIPYAVTGDPQSLSLYTNIPTVNVDTEGHKTLNANTNDRGNSSMARCQTDQCRATDAKISGAILFGFGATVTAGPEAALFFRGLLGLGMAAQVNGIGLKPNFTRP